MFSSLLIATPVVRRFMDIGFASELLAMVQGSALPLTFAAAACACFKAFTSADDIRPPASKAFLFARTLHKAHNSTEVRCPHSCWCRDAMIQQELNR